MTNIKKIIKRNVGTWKYIALSYIARLRIRFLVVFLDLILFIENILTLFQVTTFSPCTMENNRQIIRVYFLSFSLRTQETV